MRNASDSIRYLTNMATILSCEHVYQQFPGEKSPVLHDVSFSIDQGEFVCIVGPSGCGKSTLLRFLAGLEKETGGSVVRPQNISMVFQAGALMPWLSVYDNVAFGLREKMTDESAKKHIIERELNMLHIHELSAKYPSELSGGQRQRVGIARALAVEPDLLLLDEPFSALDPKTTVDLHEDLLALWKHKKITIVMISHSIEESVSLADLIIVMKAGRIDSEIKITLPYPRHEQAEAFMHHVHEVRDAFFK